MKKQTLSLLLLPLLATAACRTLPPPAAPEAKPANAVVTQRDVTDATALLPAACRPDVIKQMSIAEANAGQLVKAILDAKAGDERECIGFLLANMPEHDLKTLTAPFLLENVRLALAARKSYPWKAIEPVPQDVFLNNVLPYANVNEARDPWRAEYRRVFAPLVAKCATVEEAVTLLNDAVFKQRKVTYHATKRNKPDQSPAESEACGYASCTGLSIMLADACRAVGIPARLAGTPQWNRPEGGNHTWVEVWSGGRWHHLGAFDPAPFDKTWFDDIASKADPAKPLTWVYAVSFRRTALTFPMVWAAYNHDVSAENVTAAYLKGGGAAAPLPLALAVPALAEGKTFTATATINGVAVVIRLTPKDGNCLTYAVERQEATVKGMLGGRTGASRLRIFPMDAAADGRIKVCAFLATEANDTAGDTLLGVWSFPAPDGKLTGTLVETPAAKP